MCVARIGSLGSARSLAGRSLYSGVAVFFLVALYFTFSRGAILALAGGALVLVLLSRRRFETLGNLAVPSLAALWVVSEVRDLTGLVARPVSRQQMQIDGWLLVEPLLKAVVAAIVIQAAFYVLVWLFEGFVPGAVRSVTRAVGVATVAVGVLLGAEQAWAAFQEAGGLEGMRAQVTSGDVYSDPEIAADPTKRYASLDAAARIGLWEIAFENWREHPFSGTGGDTYQVVFEERAEEGLGDVLHPHSMWMSLLSDTGVFAFLAFAAFSAGLLTLATYNAFSVARSGHALIAGCAAAATAYLISSSIDWNWYIPASTLPFFALAAVAAGMRPGTARKSKGAL